MWLERLFNERSVSVATKTKNLHTVTRRVTSIDGTTSLENISRLFKEAKVLPLNAYFQYDRAAEELELIEIRPENAEEQAKRLTAAQRRREAAKAAAATAKLKQLERDRNLLGKLAKKLGVTIGMPVNGEPAKSKAR